MKMYNVKIDKKDGFCKDVVLTQSQLSELRNSGVDLLDVEEIKPCNPVKLNHYIQLYADRNKQTMRLIK